MKKLLSVLLTVLLVAGLSVTIMANDTQTNVVGYSADRVVPVDLTDVWCISDYYDSPLTTTEYKIVDATDLVKFAGFVNDGESFEGKTVYLAFDINMTDVTDYMTAGKTSASAFKGTFDGQGHVIDNLVLSVNLADADAVKYVGLFGHVTGATIKNVVLGSNCKFECIDSTNAYSGVQVAALVANMRAGTTIDNCYSAASVIGGNRTGGITAYSDIGPGGQSTDATSNVVLATVRKITNCTNAGSVHANAGRVGGIVGLAAGTVLEIKNCRNTGAISTDGTDNHYAAAGGFLGNTWPTDGFYSHVIIDGCINNGSVTGGGSAGGFVGCPQREVTITNSFNYGTLTGTVTGGLIAHDKNTAENATAHVLTGSEDKSQGTETDATLSTVPTITPDYPTAAEIEAEKNSYKNDSNDNNNDNSDSTDNTDNTTTEPTNNTTEAPATTEAPSTTAPSTTEAPAEEKKGCGSVVFGGMALVMLTAGAALTVCKKKD